MRNRFYAVVRDLHLYAGLFLSPFVLVFAASVFYLTHPRAPARAPESTRIVAGLSLPPAGERLAGPALAAEIRPLLDRLGVHGEVNFVRRIASKRRLVVPVLLPGSETTVDIDFARSEASIARRSSGIAGALVHLHVMPGPHNVALRGNSLYMRVWRVLTDAAAYGALFLTLSGVYLWAVLRAERRAGLICFALGAFSFFGLVYALTR